MSCRNTVTVPGASSTAMWCVTTLATPLRVRLSRNAAKIDGDASIAWTRPAGPTHRDSSVVCTPILAPTSIATSPGRRYPLMKAEIAGSKTPKKYRNRCSGVCRRPGKRAPSRVVDTTGRGRHAKYGCTMAFQTRTLPARIGKWRRYTRKSGSARATHLSLVVSARVIAAPGHPQGRRDDSNA
jgi:hypothetical protein